VDPFEDEKEEYGFDLDSGGMADLGVKKNTKKAPAQEKEDKKERKGAIELSQSSEEDEEDSVSRDDIQDNDDYGYEPGTGGNQRPPGGYYPAGGPTVV